jgi:hypothetical protein
VSSLQFCDDAVEPVGPSSVLHKITPRVGSTMRRTTLWPGRCFRSLFPAR